MSNATTWAVLTDGRYIRILVNHGTDTKLLTLKAEENDAYAELCYQVVNRKPKHLAGQSVKAEEQLDYLQLVADFLSNQYDQHLFDRMVIAAPEPVIKELKARLTDTLKPLIFGERTEDLLAKSNDEIEKSLANIIIDS